MKNRLKELNFIEVAQLCLIELAITAGTAFLFGFVVMLLWNWLMPEIFNISPITYIQSWGLVLLTNILFKSRYHALTEKRRDSNGKEQIRKNHSSEDWKREFFSKMQRIENIETDKEDD